MPRRLNPSVSTLHTFNKDSSTISCMTNDEAGVVPDAAEDVMALCSVCDSVLAVAFSISRYQLTAQKEEREERRTMQRTLWLAGFQTLRGSLPPRANLERPISDVFECCTESPFDKDAERSPRASLDCGLLYNA